ncbi:MAG: Acyltransferase 3 [Rhodocyclales bacterium]|nr:Acyltransferase 3 [Rhodocyclales bacterium]
MPGLPWSIDIAPITLAFFLAGLYFRAECFDFHPTPLLVVLATGIFAVCHSVFSEYMDLNLRHYGQALVSTLQAATGIYLTLTIASTLKKLPTVANILAFVGRGSLFILIFHFFFQNKTARMFENLTGVSRQASYLVAFLPGVVGPLFIMEIVKRVPWLALLLLPNRKNRARNGEVQEIAA